MSGSVAVDLLRHGETSLGARYCGSTDVPLTDNGWKQMCAAVAANHDWRRIYSSPLSRCAKFAEHLARQLAVPVAFDSRLREMHFGEWEGRTSADLMETEPQALLRFWEDPWRNGPPGAEPLEQLRDRVVAIWEEIAGKQEPALVISHGGPIRVILLHVYGLPSAQVLNVEALYATLLHTQVSAASRHASGPAR